MTVIDEPAAAVAAGLCLTARVIADHSVTTRHPSRCGWCAYPTVELAVMISGFNAWAGFDERRGTYQRHDARIFGELPRDRQRALVVEAQAFEADDPPPPEPLTAPIAPPADVDAPPVTTQEVPSWLFD